MKHICCKYSLFYVCIICHSIFASTHFKHIAAGGKLFFESHQTLFANLEIFEMGHGRREEVVPSQCEHKLSTFNFTVVIYAALPGNNYFCQILVKFISEYGCFCFHGSGKNEDNRAVRKRIYLML